MGRNLYREFAEPGDGVILHNMMLKNGKNLHDDVGLQIVVSTR